jgi:hypothetical protein
MGWLTLGTNQRQNISLWVMFGGALVFTAYAIAALFMVSAYPKYVLWLGVLAHIQIFSIIAGFIALLVKRRISAGKDGVTITDDGFNEGDD